MNFHKKLLFLFVSFFSLYRFLSFISLFILLFFFIFSYFFLFLPTSLCGALVFGSKSALLRLRFLRHLFCQTSVNNYTLTLTCAGAAGRRVCSRGSPLVRGRPAIVICTHARALASGFRARYW